MKRKSLLGLSAYTIWHKTKLLKMKKYHNIGYMMTDNKRNKTRYNLNISNS